MKVHPARSSQIVNARLQISDANDSGFSASKRASGARMVCGAWDLNLASWVGQKDVPKSERKIFASLSEIFSLAFTQQTGQNPYLGTCDGSGFPSIRTTGWGFGDPSSSYNCLSERCSTLDGDWRSIFPRWRSGKDGIFVS